MHEKAHEESKLPVARDQYANLVRDNPSKTYFARIRINGKLIRRKLKTKVLAVARPSLSSRCAVFFRDNAMH